MQAWENIAKIGTIVEVDASARALAKVNIMGRTSDMLPVLHFANSFKRSINPLRVDEQVMVICPHGEANGGFIIRGVFNTSCKEPTGASATCEVTEYEDGTRFSYDSAAKEFKIEASDKITIICKSATILSDNLSITANTNHNGDVSINGNLIVSGTISDAKGDLTSHSHPDASAR
ncbi:MAG: phage baseplate assembly protein V [Sulfurospirillum sp.]|nr:phage baseplate assembly protein V [Sulfurospirillum sp.]